MRRAFIAGVALILAEVLNSAVYSEDLERLLRTEAWTSWQRYKERCKNLQGRARFVFQDLTRSPPETMSDERMEFRQLGECAYVRNDELGPTSRTTRLMGINESYFFLIERVRNTGAWRLHDIQHRDTMPRALDIINPLMTIEAMFRARTWNLNFLGIRDKTLLDEDVVLKSVQWVDTEQGKGVRVEFSYEKELPRFKIRREGWVILQPDRYWLILRGEAGGIHAEEGTPSEWHAIVERTDVEYAQLSDGFPVLRRGKAIYEYPGKREIYVSLAEFEFWESPKPSPEEFRLPYYGLPEPAGLRKPRPWWLYISLMGLALVVIGLSLAAYLRWRRSRLAQISAN